jgi:hypothetical protein
MKQTQVDEGAFMWEVKAHDGDSLWGIFPFVTKGIFFNKFHKMVHLILSLNFGVFAFKILFL